MKMKKSLKMAVIILAILILPLICTSCNMDELLMEWFETEDDFYYDENDKGDGIIGAICEACIGDMAIVAGCKSTAFIHEGKSYERF